jgi:hypothetical protein
VNSISANQEVCKGGTATFTVSASGGTPSLTYQWQAGMHCFLLVKESKKE